MISNGVYASFVKRGNENNSFNNKYIWYYRSWNILKVINVIESEGEKNNKDSFKETINDDSFDDIKEEKNFLELLSE